MNTVFNKQPMPVIAGMAGVLILLFSVSLLGTEPVLRLAGLTAINETLLVVSRVLYWIILGLLWLYAVKVEKQSLLMWEEKRYDFLFYILSVILMFLLLFAGIFIIRVLCTLSGFNDHSTRMAAIIKLMKGKYWLLVFTSLTAGVVEELIFRGYLLPRLTVIFKNTAWAIVVTSILFGLLHFRYGTIFNIAGPAFIGFVFACHYQKYRNIKVLIGFHFLWDLLALYVSVKR